jgi:hypothetical protein
MSIHTISKQRAALAVALESASTTRALSFALTRDFLKQLRAVAASEAKGLTYDVITNGTANYGNSDGRTGCASFTHAGVTVYVNRETAEVIE